MDLQQERQQAHAMIDLLPPAHEQVLAKFGLTMVEWEKMSREPELNDGETDRLDRKS